MSTPRAAVTAAAFAGLPELGVLFNGGIGNGHGCTASVVDSATRDLVVTAAHCVSGTGVGLQFVPGYDDGRMPYGIWTVQAAYTDASWVSSQDPRHDYVFLRVAAQVTNGATHELQDVVGADTLGLAPAEGDAVTVSGYAAGQDDQPLRCGGAVSLTAQYPTFRCGGLVDGTSGGPWLSDGAGNAPTVLVGIIGGLEQGGCDDDTSYSAPFDLDTVRTWQRASTDAASDVLPMPSASGC